MINFTIYAAVLIIIVATIVNSNAAFNAFNASGVVTPPSVDARITETADTRTTMAGDRRVVQ